MEQLVGFFFAICLNRNIEEITLDACVLFPIRATIKK